MTYKYKIGEKVIIKNAPNRLKHLIGTTGIIRQRTQIVTYQAISYYSLTTTTGSACHLAYCLNGYPEAFYEEWLELVVDPIEILVTDDEFDSLFG